MRVAGLAPVESIPGLENIDVTQFVNGHMAYRAAMPRLLREVGWEVESDEFTEIEDPDPDNHEKRQRELIRELDEARKDAEAMSGKRRFGLFKRGKLARKKGWETYDDSMRDGGEGSSSAHGSGADGGDPGGNVLFDIDAIRAELASEMIEVKQLESTLPPMKLDINGAKSDAEWSERNGPSPPRTEPDMSDKGMGTRTTEDTTLAVRSAPANNSNSQSHDTNPNPYDQAYDEYTVSPLSTHSNTTIPNGIPSPNNNTDPRSTTTTGVPSPHWLSSSFSSDFRAQSNPSIPTDTDAMFRHPNNNNNNNNPSTSTPQPQRPPLTTSTTLPTTGTTTADPRCVEHNAWLEDEDEDEEEFGQEKEVKMTFG